jgi:hypothetical protein
MLTTAFGENPFDKLKVNKDFKQVNEPPKLNLKLSLDFLNSMRAYN